MLKIKDTGSVGLPIQCKYYITNQLWVTAYLTDPHAITHAHAAKRARRRITGINRAEALLFKYPKIRSQVASEVSSTFQVGHELGNLQRHRRLTS
jgi:hypothetical protein